MRFAKLSEIHPAYPRLITEYIDYRNHKYHLDHEHIDLLLGCIQDVQSSEIGHARNLGEHIIFGVACGIHFHRANLTQTLQTIPQSLVDADDPTWERYFLYEIAEFLSLAYPAGGIWSLANRALLFRRERRYRAYRHSLLRSYRVEKQQLLLSE